MKLEGAWTGRKMDAALELKADSITAEGEFEGYASVFNVVDQGGDAVQPGAFIDGIARAKAERRFIPLLWQHDRREPMGTWPDMAEDAKGLWVRGKLVLEDNPVAKRAHSLLKAGALGGLSIGYRIPAAGAEEDPKRRGIYLLKKVDLVEISLVTMPMLIQARVSAVKSLLEGGVHPSVADLVGVLEELGYEKSLAQAIGENSRPLLEKRTGDEGLAQGLDAFYKAVAATDVL